MKKILTIITVVLMMCVLTVSAYAAPVSEDTANTEKAAAETEKDDSNLSAKAIGAAIVVGMAAAAGAIGMAMAIGKSVEGISRQPEAESAIRTNLMLGLVFIETVIIYALIVAILLIFVL